MGNYKLNDYLDDVQAFHYDGTYEVFLRLSTLLKESKIGKYISVIEPMFANPEDKNHINTFLKAIEDVTAVIMWHSGIMNSDYNTTRVVPHSVLVTKVYPFTDNQLELALMFTLDKRTFDVFYKATN